MNYVFPFSIRENLGKISFLVGMLIFCKLGCNLLRRLTIFGLEQIFDYRFFEQIIQQLLSLPYSYYKNRTTGELLTRIQNARELKNFFMALFQLVFLRSSFYKKISSVF